MEYIINIDSLVDCLELIETPLAYNGKPCVYLDDVLDMIYEFPKKEYKDNVSNK